MQPPNTPSQEELQLAESLLIISTQFESPEDITSALRFIEGYQVKEDYAKLLINIIQSDIYCPVRTLSALAQLKVLIQSYWKQDNAYCHGYCLSPNVKKYVMSRLFPLIFQLEDNYTYTRFLMEIVKMVGENFCQELILSGNIGQQFMNNINKEQYLRSCLMLFLGICKKYQHKHNTTEFISFNSLLELYWPIIFEKIYCLISKTKELEGDNTIAKWQIFYLSMKIACKCMNRYTSLESKKFSFEWVSIAIELLRFSDYFITKSDIFQWNNGTTQFYIHHTYKWSLKYLTLFTCGRLAIKKDTPQQLCILSNSYVDSTYPDMIKFVCELLTKIRIEKERYHEVNLLRAMVDTKQSFFRKQVRQETSLILCRLLPIMELTQIDKDTVESSPQTFLENQFNGGQNKIFPIESPRHQALATWKRVIGIALLDPNKVSQHIFQTAFAWLEKLWESSDSQNIQICFKILAQITPNSNHKYLEKYLRSFAQRIPICLNNGGWPAVRALQFFANTKLQIQGKTLEYIHLWIQNKILCSDHPRGVQVLLVVFSCLCLNRLYSYDEIKQKALKSNFQQIFDKIILEVLKQNPCQRIMYCVKELAAIGFEHIMIQKSIRTAIIMRDLIFQYLGKQNETNDRNKQDQYTEMIIEASDTITFIVSIMSSQYKRQVETNSLLEKTIGLQKELENVILSLFFRVMEENVEDFEQFIQFISPLLSSYLHTFAPNNQNFIIILRGLVFRITGIHQQIVDTFKENISQAQYKILSQCSLTDLKYELSPYLPIFRNILKYIPLSPETIIRESKQLFSNLLSANHFQLLLFLADSFYIKEAQQKGEYNHGKCLSSLLIIYILEIKGSTIPHNILGWIFNRILFMVNYINKTSFMLKYIIQIFLLWISIQEDEQLKVTIESIPTQTKKKLMRTLFMNPYDKGFPQFQDDIFEWKRATLGMAKLLNLKTRNPHLELFVQDQIIISWLIFSTYKIFENPKKHSDDSQDRVSRLAQNFNENQENEFYELSEKQSVGYHIDDSNHDFYEQPIDSISISLNCLQCLKQYQNAFIDKYNKIVKLDQDNNDYLQHILQQLLDLQIYEFSMNRMEYLDLADQQFYRQFIEQKNEEQQIQYYSRMYE